MSLSQPKIISKLGITSYTSPLTHQILQYPYPNPSYPLKTSFEHDHSISYNQFFLEAPFDIFFFLAKIILSE